MLLFIAYPMVYYTISQKACSAAVLFLNQLTHAAPCEEFKREKKD
jgi:hypothetical protein